MHVVSREKITRYLLNLSHPDGAAKARFFVAHGFSPDLPGELERALSEHPRSARLVSDSEHVDGRKLVYECAIATPRGYTCIRSVWIADASDATRLVTAYPFV